MNVIAETLILCGFFGVIIRFVDIERTVGHHSLHFHFIITTDIQSLNKKKYLTYIFMFCKLQHGMQ